MAIEMGFHIAQFFSSFLCFERKKVRINQIIACGNKFIAIYLRKSQHNIKPRLPKPKLTVYLRASYFHLKANVIPQKWKNTFSRYVKKKQESQSIRKKKSSNELKKNSKKLVVDQCHMSDSESIATRFENGWNSHTCQKTVGVSDMDDMD